MSNEYLDLLREKTGKADNFPLHVPSSKGDYGEFRFEMTKMYSWAIPNDEALKTIEVYQPIVEIGAGSGYWAFLLRSYRRAEIVAYDGFSSKFGYKQEDTWTKVERGGPEVLQEYGPGWNLFLCWPPYDDPFADECLQAFNGNFVIYIGEDPSGCTGDKDFHIRLAKEFRIIKTVEIPSYQGIYDALRVFMRRKVPLTDEQADVTFDEYSGKRTLYRYTKNPDLHERNLEVGRLKL
jgi:hypothetical protein